MRFRPVGNALMIYTQMSFYPLFRHSPGLVFVKRTGIGN